MNQKNNDDFTKAMEIANHLNKGFVEGYREAEKIWSNAIFEVQQKLIRESKVK